MTREEQLRAYLAGKLEEADADQFERACLEDDELAAELELALQVRAAALAAAPTPGSVERRRQRWGWLAAACLGALAIGGVMIGVTDRPQEVMRDGDSAWSLETRRIDRRLRLSWHEVDGAEGGYVVQVFDAEGSLLIREELAPGATTLDLPAPPAARRLFVRARALGPLREVIAETPLEEISIPPSVPEG